MKKILLPALIVFSLFSANCLTNVEDNTGEIPSEPISYASDIQPIFNARCTVCHGNNGGVNLSSYQALMNSTGNFYGTNLVVPGDAAASGLVDVLEPNPQNNNPMPQGSSLSGNDIEKIRAWINEGALNN
ncbi:MAG: hypothetical protein JJ971_10855 [Balneolaceae bacterium]|nr:hypothetical protein [Balneolaceae bacterium]MBO6546254.1 hypothetical protein [Balneolaceae bacterium]MBO6648613.1 hypothetical protein [Balneolaceae bacterium]